MRAPEPAGGGGMDNRIFLGTTVQRMQFVGRHDVERKSEGRAGFVIFEGANVTFLARVCLDIF